MILVDLRMPGMDGLSATRQIRLRGDAKALLPIIVVTADTSSDLQDRCTSASADCVMMKPVAMANLIDTIGKMMARASGPNLMIA